LEYVSTEGASQSAPKPTASKAQRLYQPKVIPEQWTGSHVAARLVLAHEWYWRLPSKCRGERFSHPDSLYDIDFAMLAVPPEQEETRKRVVALFAAVKSADSKRIPLWSRHWPEAWPGRVSFAWAEARYRRIHIKAVADMLGVSEGAVQMAKDRACKKAAAALNRDGEPVW